MPPGGVDGARALASARGMIIHRQPDGSYLCDVTPGQVAMVIRDQTEDEEPNAAKRALVRISLLTRERHWEGRGPNRYQAVQRALIEYRTSARRGDALPAIDEKDVVTSLHAAGIAIAGVTDPHRVT